MLYFFQAWHVITGYRILTWSFFFSADGRYYTVFLLSDVSHLKVIVLFCFYIFLFDFLWVQANVSSCSFAVVPLTHCSYDLFILVDVLTCEFVCVCSQLYLTLWDPMNCSLPGSSVHGISQTRMLEWIATSFSSGFSRPRDWTIGSCLFFTTEPPGKPICEFTVINNSIKLGCHY